MADNGRDSFYLSEDIFCYRRVYCIRVFSYAVLLLCISLNVIGIFIKNFSITQGILVLLLLVYNMYMLPESLARNSLNLFWKNPYNYNPISVAREVSKEFPKSFLEKSLKIKDCQCYQGG